MFFIESIDYTEDFFHTQSESRHYWALEGLNLSQFTLIAGLNAVGKSRICRVIRNTISLMIFPGAPTLGKTEITFRIGKEKCYTYIKEVRQGNDLRKVIAREELHQRGKRKPLFDRNVIYDSRSGRRVPYSPPVDQLTFHSRRDRIRHDYIENIIGAAKKFHFLDFDEPKAYRVGTEPLAHLPLEIQPSLTSSAFEGLVDEEKKRSIIADINRMGFPITDMFVKKVIMGGQIVPMLFIKEAGVKGTFGFVEASAGMFRIVFLMVFLNLIEEGSCVLIDNAADGLDYKRSMSLPKYVERASKKKQIIMVSNNEILLNQTDVRNWNVLSREGPKVKAYNYKNSKERLTKFADSGLSSYEYFKEQYYLDWKDQS
jgi:hypothetical protein